MKIIFMGTPDFAVHTLDALMEAGCEVSLVVTQPDRRKGRSREPQKPPVKLCAEKWGIPVFQPERVRRPEVSERLRQEGADLIVVAAFGQILSQEILDMPAHGAVNVHASLLPKYRGAAPIQWAVINGEKESGVTIMQMDAGLDTGDILLQRAVPLEEGETAESLYDKLAVLGGELLVEALPQIEAGTLSPAAQDPAAMSYAKMLHKEMGNIDWNSSAQRIERLVRGLRPWPCAFTSFRGKELKLWRAECAGGRAQGAPGTVLSAERDRLLVNTGEGVLALTELQMEGKKRLPAREFLLGCQVGPGEKLGDAGGQDEHMVADARTTILAFISPELHRSHPFFPIYSEA